MQLPSSISPIWSDIRTELLEIGIGFDDMDYKDKAPSDFFFHKRLYAHSNANPYPRSEWYTLYVDKEEEGKKSFKKLFNELQKRISDVKKFGQPHRMIDCDDGSMVMWEVNNTVLSVVFYNKDSMQSLVLWWESKGPFYNLLINPDAQVDSLDPLRTS